MFVLYGSDKVKDLTIALPGHLVQFFDDLLFGFQVSLPQYYYAGLYSVNIIRVSVYGNSADNWAMREGM